MTHVTHIITGLNDGGAEGVLYRLCIHDTENHHVVISLMDNGKFGPLLRAAGVEVHCLGMTRGQITARAVWRLWQLLRMKRTEVVQTWMYHSDLVGGTIARLTGINAVCWGIRHTVLDRSNSCKITILVARLCAKLSRWAPRVIVSCSEEAARVHKRLGYAPNKFITIPNGYDLKQFIPDSSARIRLRSEWGINDDTPLIGMVARYNSQKDHKNLITALQHLRNIAMPFKCILVGTGMDCHNATFYDCINKAGLNTNIVLLGQRADVPAVMNALDLHVLSSSFGEAFPNVIAEAMACGTPCITTDVGDAAMIVGKTGWVVPPGNSEALAKALIHAINEWKRSTTWQGRCRDARDRIEQHFSIDRMVKKYHDAWRLAQNGIPNQIKEERFLT